MQTSQLEQGVSREVGSYYCELHPCFGREFYCSHLSCQKFICCRCICNHEGHSIKHVLDSDDSDKEGSPNVENLDDESLDKPIWILKSMLSNNEKMLSEIREASFLLKEISEKSNASINSKLEEWAQKMFNVQENISKLEQKIQKKLDEVDLFPNTPIVCPIRESKFFRTKPTSFASIDPTQFQSLQKKKKMNNDEWDSVLPTTVTLNTTPNFNSKDILQTHSQNFFFPSSSSVNEDSKLNFPKLLEFAKNQTISSNSKNNHEAKEVEIIPRTEYSETILNSKFNIGNEDLIKYQTPKNKIRRHHHSKRKSTRNSKHFEIFSKSKTHSNQDILSNQIQNRSNQVSNNNSSAYELLASIAVSPNDITKAANSLEDLKF